MRTQGPLTPNMFSSGSNVFVSEVRLRYVISLLESMETILNDHTTTSLSSGTQLAFMDGHDTRHTSKIVVLPVTSFETLGDLVTSTLGHLQQALRNT